jgi:hypothetical protein
MVKERKRAKPKDNRKFDEQVLFRGRVVQVERLWTDLHGRYIVYADAKDKIYRVMTEKESD